MSRRPVRTIVVYSATTLVPAALAIGAVVLLAPGHHGGHAIAAGGGLVLYHLLLAIAAAVAAAALGGTAAQRLGQPVVIGELAAGLALGPSVLGWLEPSVQAWLFPAPILPYLSALAQIGVILFIFLVGCELDWGLIRTSGSRSLVVGHASVAVPFFVGILFAAALPDRLRPPGISDAAFLIFVGLSLSISAFPVLARILTERGLLRTPIGTAGIAAAGVADVTAWCLLVAVVAYVRGTSVWAAVWTVLLVAGFTAVLIFLVRPLLARAAAGREADGDHRTALFALCTFVLLVSSAVTDLIGAHAIFGAFLAGLIMPRGSSAIAELTTKLEGVAMWVLLPLFFVVFGLQLDLRSLDMGDNLPILVTLVLLAIVAKIGGTTAAAVATGSGKRDSLALGLMMNCRGLTELIVLSIGLQLGVLNRALFAMFVVMALLTTAITGPLLHRVLPAPLTVPAPAPSLFESR
jgi:Kef-type K+ transport system membrane component KefB